MTIIESDLSTPEALMRAFARRLNSGDLDGLVDLYEPVAVFEPQPGATVRGRHAIRTALGELLALRPTIAALDATQEILVKVLTRLATFKREAAFTTWVHRVAVNHLLDRKRSAAERFELTFGSFADDLHDGLTPVAPNAGPELDLLAREVKHGCTLALLTCLDRASRVAYVLLLGSGRFGLCS